MKKDKGAKRIKPFWKARKALAGCLDRLMTPRSRKPQWRSAVGAPHHRSAPADPDRVNIEHVRDCFRQAERAADSAGVPRPRFPFEPRDVVAIHTRHSEHGKGLWFRLENGRVFRDTGEFETTAGAYD